MPKRCCWGRGGSRGHWYVTVDLMGQGPNGCVMARSSFGVVIFSEAFFAKGWPQYELDGIVTRAVAGEQNLLPIWHKITKDEVRAQNPSLAGKVARSTSQFSVQEIAEEIAKRVRPELFS